MTTLAYVGNFAAPHSTENHVRLAWKSQGHTVVRVQEGDPSEYDSLMKNLKAFDLVLWTRTASLAEKWGHRKQIELLTAAERLGIPTVAYHLDRWWGLEREASVWEEPFFRCQYVITADGGHQDEFAALGVNHTWMPPAVSLGETEPGTVQERFQSDIAFVGSWMPGYHKEWKHRPQLVDFLQRRYRQRVRFWPKAYEPTIRGTDLRDLYASVKVVVGDSCLVGDATHYWSDRIPETIGRGAFLLHPAVVGLEDHFMNGADLVTWPLGNWKELQRHIDWYLAHDSERKEIAEQGRNHVIAHHTYDVRVQQILELIK